MPQSLLMVEPIPILKDNYVWMFKTGDRTVAAVDPGEATSVIRYLDGQGTTLSHILITHHHHDHIGGVDKLKNLYNPVVIGAEKDQSRLPNLDWTVEDGQEIEVGEHLVKVIEVPGHTLGHVVYCVEDALFSGDTLFRFGCGRLFEGTPEQMWKSLLKIRALPDSTSLYAAHEYTQINLEFACSLELNNPALHALLEVIFHQTNLGQATMPCLLGEEKCHNPFLRADDAVFAKNIGMSGQSPEKIFTTIRKKRNTF